MSAPVPAMPYRPAVDAAEAAELLELLELCRTKRDDVARDLAELRTAPERLDRRGRLLARVIQEALAAEHQLWHREVAALETSALLLALDTSRPPR